MSNLDLLKDRAENEKKQKESERTELFKSLKVWAHSLHLDPVPDPEHNADGVFSFVDENSLTRCDNNQNKINAIIGWVTLKVTQHLKEIMTEDSKAGKRLRTIVTHGWGVKIVHQNSERELRRKFWFEITGKVRKA